VIEETTALDDSHAEMMRFRPFLSHHHHHQQQQL